MSAAEIVKPDRVEMILLARTLCVPVERLAYLADLPDEELRAFRKQVSKALFDANSHGIARLARVSGIVPVAVMANVAQRSRSALFVASFARVLDLSKAVGVAQRLRPPLLAEVAAELDPAEVRTIVGALPPALIVNVAVELQARADWMTLANMVGHLPWETVARALAELGDVALVQTSNLVGDAALRNLLVELTPVERIAGLVAAVAEHNLWTEAAAAIGHLPEDKLLAATKAAAALGPSEHASFAALIANARNEQES
ncbi:hypothetical protein ACIRRA_41745 [Nocardia sp. NPDC101769]|uniref:hypothetical protein n=1 Tax=Nocardia sp. NPDC101769 TaxID=3364333 RepID=UPI00382E0FC2